MLLDSIIGQMNKQIILLVHVVGLARHSDVPLFKVVALVFWSD